MTNFGYIIMDETWYAPDTATDEIIVYKSPDYEGGVDYEFTLKWKQLGNKPTLQVTIFEDALAAFIDMPNLFTELAALHMTDPQKKDVVALLNKLGYKDTTERVNPDFGTGSFRDPSARYYVAENGFGTWSVYDKKSNKKVLEFKGVPDREKLACDMAKILNDAVADKL